MSEAGHPDPARGNARTVEWPVCILLVGLTGAGKSTVGRELSARIGYRFVDLDQEIVSQDKTAYGDVELPIPGDVSPVPPPG